MKRIVAALVIGAVVLLAGCGGGGTKITLFTWTSNLELAANQRLVDEFMQTHPGIKVEIVSEPGDRAMEKLKSMVAAGNAPDVMSIHGASFIPMAANGSLLDLDPLIKEDKGFDLADFYPSLVEQCRYQGALYSLPRYTSVYVLFYNRDHFDAAGLKYPDATWTWDDYLAAAQKLTVKSTDPTRQRYGAIIDFWGSRIYPWVWAAGGEVLDKSQTRCLLGGPAPIEGLQFLVDLRLKYGVCPPNTVAEKKQSVSTFTTGKASMFQTGAWDIQSMRATKGLHWGVAPLPKRKVHATLLGMENYALGAKTKHPKEAWLLFTYLLGAQCQGTMANELEKQPSRQSVANGVFLQTKTDYDRRVLVDALAYAHQAPNVPQWDRVSHFIQEQLDLMWLGKTSVPAGAKKAAEQVTEGLRETR